MRIEDENMSIKNVKARFDTQGFAVVDGLASEDELVDLRTAYDDLLKGDVDGGAIDRDLGGLTRQIMLPHLSNPLFSKHPAVDRARQYASALVGVENPEILFSMLIYKPPGHPHPTPWHQDMAYAGSPFSPKGTQLPNDAIAQFWLALDDVDENMGCMEFVPGMHNAPMPEHKVASGDPADDSRLLEIVNPKSALDLKTAIACPLPAGSATVHGYAAPHYTGPNRSKTKGRRAFIFSFANSGALAALSKAAEQTRQSAP